MRDQGPTCIGLVKRVLGAQVIVTLDPTLAGVAPVYQGRLQKIGQVGSIVRVPQGLVDLIGQVSLLGIGDSRGNSDDKGTFDVGERWLQIELIGEIDRGTNCFQRGVGSYPGLDDPVHFTTAEDLETIFPGSSEGSIQLGRLSATEGVSICLDAAKLVSRHSVIVGSTGAGKTSCVASILQSIARGGWDSANVVVIDPHGEYSTALANFASVRSVLGRSETAIRVPFWALPCSQILATFAGVSGGATTQARFAELVTQSRRDFTAEAKWLDLDPVAITADTPVPFDLHAVWFQLDAENNETWREQKKPETAAIITDGDAVGLKSRIFQAYGLGSASPYKAPLHGMHGSVPELLRLGLLDPRRAFLREPAGTIEGEDPLVEEMANWLGREKPISILDFSGVPDEASEVAIGVIVNLIFEAAVRTQAVDNGIGRPRPVLIVIEEAHRFLAASATSSARDAVNRIAREGRKYGVGLMLVTQRPSELPDTALAQSGTVVALRLSNAADQAKVRASLPDTVAGLAAVLPSLRTGEAIISGEAIALPARTLIDPPSPFPNAHDPSLSAWRAAATTPSVATALRSWRGTYNKENE